MTLNLILSFEIYMKTYFYDLRYKVGELEKKCKQAGFKILANKNVDFSIYFLFVLLHKLSRRFIYCSGCTKTLRMV